MNRVYQVLGVLFLLFSIFVAREALGLEYYTPVGPGPGFFPLWLSGILGLLAASMLYQAVFGPPEPLPEGFYPSRAGWLRIGAILFALAWTVVMLRPLGFRLTMLAFCLFLLFTLGRQNLVMTILVSLAGSFGVFYVFERLLHVPLPTGMFGI